MNVLVPGLPPQYREHPYVSRSKISKHCGLVTPCGDIDLGHILRGNGTKPLPTIKIDNGYVIISQYAK